MNKHVNIALFVPHAGCPHMCSFCNQRTISGKTEPLRPDEIDRAVETAVASGNRGGELAFFGGSFTAVDRDYMISLLERAKKYIDSGDISGIRCSTRPDAIDEEILDILTAYGVTAVELGAQSMDDRVLELNLRGHNSEKVRTASALIKQSGIELGLQMMTGLFGDSEGASINTAKEFIKLEPATVRIYPTIVLASTRLAELYETGKYRPETVDEAAELCSKLLLMFYNADIKVIRLGLHSGGGVEDGYIAGPYHPAFGEICESMIYRRKAEKHLLSLPRGEYILRVAPSEISKAIGQKKSNILHFESLGYKCRVKPCEVAKRYEINIENV